MTSYIHNLTAIINYICSRVIMWLVVSLYKLNTAHCTIYTVWIHPPSGVRVDTPKVMSLQ